MEWNGAVVVKLGKGSRFEYFLEVNSKNSREIGYFRFFYS